MLLVEKCFTRGLRSCDGRLGGTAWLRFLHVCQGLLHGLLSYDPTTRYTVEKALEHPFLSRSNGLGASCKSVSDGLPMEALQTEMEVVFRESCRLGFRGVT